MGGADNRFSNVTKNFFDLTFVPSCVISIKCCRIWLLDFDNLDPDLPNLKT